MSMKLGEEHENNAISALMERNDVISTLMRGGFDVVSTALFSVIFFRTLFLCVTVIMYGFQILKQAASETLAWSKDRSSTFAGRHRIAILRNDTKLHSDSKVVRHIGFLKVHKAGSTMVQNMLFRFGLKYNLSFVLPHNSSGTVMPLNSDDHYDILAIHSVLNNYRFKQLQSDRVNIAIIREPLDVTISAAYYCRDLRNISYLLKVPKETFIRDLIIHPELYDPGFFSRTKNTMDYDFGFERYRRKSKQRDTITAFSRHLRKNTQSENGFVGYSTHFEAGDTYQIHSYLKYLNKEFKLVMILEKNEESLVLLRQYLNWEMSDIVYLPINSNSHPLVKVTREERARHKAINFLDYALYDFFVDEFERKVKIEGDRFQDEVKHFKRVLNQIMLFCENKGNGKDVLEIFPSLWNDYFVKSRTDCEMMAMPERTFKSKLME